MSTLPLFSTGSTHDVFAWRADGPVSRQQFLAEAHWLADRLPAGEWLLNVCQDRYRFALGFVAGLLAGKTSLQPSSLTANTLQRLATDYPGAVCLSDGEFASAPLPQFEFPTIPSASLNTLAPNTPTASANGCAPSAIPSFDADRVAAILFTSGSTGLPQPHQKTWGKLVLNARAGANSLGLIDQPHHIVGTVPSQHSYGFESTFLLALQSNCAFWAGKPFFPQDIASALAAVPRPRLLVTTPFHLSTLLAADIPLPPTDRILSATAVLSTELAAQAEARCNAPVQEIYGSTETGQIAYRRTTEGPTWQLLAGVELAQTDGQTWAFGGHVERRMALGDRIEQLPNDCFLLHGRHADLINIAGRRTSLAYLNHQISEIPGVTDAAFFLPDEVAANSITRLAAFAVAPGFTARQLQAALRQRIDPIFLPRPLVLLDALPRNSTGKLPRSELQALYAKHTAHG